MDLFTARRNKRKGRKGAKIAKLTLVTPLRGVTYPVALSATPAMTDETSTGVTPLSGVTRENIFSLRLCALCVELAGFGRESKTIYHKDTVYTEENISFTPPFPRKRKSTPRRARNLGPRPSVRPVRNDGRILNFSVPPYLCGEKKPSP